MKMEQVYELANGITTELLGESAVVSEDLSNVVDMGKAIFDNVELDKYVNSLSVIIVNSSLDKFSSKSTGSPIPMFLDFK